MEHGFRHDDEQAQEGETHPPATAHRLSGQTAGRTTQDEYDVHADLPDALPVTNEEIALLRAFLSDEIKAILHGKDYEG